MDPSIDIWIMAPNRARRDWLSDALSGSRFVRIAGAAATFPFLRSLMSESPADLALIDLQSPDSQVVREWLFELLDLAPIVLLSSEPDTAVFNRILHAGTGGILQNEASADQIVQAIRSVASGLLVFDGALQQNLAPQRDDNPPVDPLTPREGEVLRLLADGLGNREIAARMNVSEHTIKFHIRSILAKLGASSRTEAVTRGLRSGLIEL